MVTDKAQSGGSSNKYLSQAEDDGSATANADALDFGFLPELVTHHFRLLSVDLTRTHAKLFTNTPLEKGIGKMTTLMLVSQNPNVNQSTIARAVNKDRSAVMRIIDGLEREGLLSREASPTERRAHALVLTRKGKVELKRYQELARACDSAFSKGLSSDERKELLRLLRKLRVLHAPDAIGIE